MSSRTTGQAGGRIGGVGAAGTIRTIGAVVLLALALAALAAPAIAPHPSHQQFADFTYAPPMRVRVIDEAGRWRAPFVYPLRLVDRLERRYEEDRAHPVALAWFSDGRLVRSADPAAGPLLLLGADALGRDVLARVLEGARTSLGVALAGVLGALLLGALVGAVAGYAGGALDEGLMRGAEFVLVLPAIYVILALRAVMPLVLSALEVFLVMAILLALVGWPPVARGVRAIVAAEGRREYAEAARSLGAGHARILGRHLLPAARGFLLVQATILLPAFILAEATLSYVGLGFAEPRPSWGAMLREAAGVRTFGEFPWLLAPAGAIIAVVLAVNLITGPAAATPGWAGRDGK